MVFNGFEAILEIVSNFCNGFDDLGAWKMILMFQKSIEHTFNIQVYFHKFATISAWNSQFQITVTHSLWSRGIANEKKGIEKACSSQHQPKKAALESREIQ